MNIRRLGILLVLVLTLFLFTGCSCAGEEPEEEPEVYEEPSPTPTPTPEPEEDLTPRNPLTGVAVEEEVSHMRPWAVLLDNVPRALPQNGISQADIIYEIPVEGGITRILAVFQDISDVGEIGPVRSTRHYFSDVVQGHNAIFVHAGGSPQGYESIRNQGISNIDGVAGSGREFYRDQERARQAGSEHSLMTSDELLLDNIGGFSYPREHDPGFNLGLLFAEDGRPQGGQSAREVHVIFSNFKTGIFSYDSRTGLYLVSQYDEPHIDGQSEEQLAVTNVLVIFADFSVIDGEGRLNVDFSLGGTGYFISGGEMVPINWTKPWHESPFRFTLEDGQPITLGEGKSYINIVNSNTGSVTFN